MNRAVEALNLLRMNDPDRLGDWFGRFITIYRAAGEVHARRRHAFAHRDRMGPAARRHPAAPSVVAHGLAPHPRQGRAGTLFVSGQDHALPAADAAAIANAAALDGATYAALSEAGRD